ncbi:DUF1491 family protein [Rhizobiaceae bacterium n13]|uniref:DUF1491 family protein n=1 Tax=Ferirhizobium litorale TaxID=2927786 RepID=A0AAE3QCN6_9HYPH|nr:DUF1491 family protein [Fererhizobium litorale]MDI7861281.1 DUF1491 family protein [Fererhizobium litorale]MDI7921428.1 DUF1491 family protein [Fererhizobium litorale]
MRIRTEIFVSALNRRVFAQGGFAAVEHKGADSSGAIFIRQRFRDGSESLFAPAPQSFFDEGDSDGRLFERLLDRAAPGEVAERLQRELKFDPDLWIVEFELDEIGDLLPIAVPDGE